MPSSASCCRAVSCPLVVTLIRSTTPCNPLRLVQQTRSATAVEPWVVERLHPVRGPRRCGGGRGLGNRSSVDHAGRRGAGAPGRRMEGIGFSAAAQGWPTTGRLRPAICGRPSHAVAAGERAFDMWSSKSVLTGVDIRVRVCVVFSLLRAKCSGTGDDELPVGSTARRPDGTGPVGEPTPCQWVRGRSADGIGVTVPVPATG
ncbi:hypothetical protein F4559_002704 [Saccharothrix violaceirubra]|uniref:Uncharacterized protein n=1 Tax=Saccharothrix violaceirubra TaxID=413306 RepID=A0A7W7WVI2_9PSEU|nr:hypothetical protein [Saccharothrix violaceirubra]